MQKLVDSPNMFCCLEFLSLLGDGAGSFRYLNQNVGPWLPLATVAASLAVFGPSFESFVYFYAKKFSSTAFLFEPVSHMSPPAGYNMHNQLCYAF